MAVAACSSAIRFVRHVCADDPPVAYVKNVRRNGKEQYDERSDL
jgi:hypothetical protein